MNKFTILGERCSGTNFLQLAIQDNFDLKITWDYGWKHFFGFNSYNNSDDVLFISIVRHPLDWINSFYRTPHHLPQSLRHNIHTFLKQPIFSVYDSGKGKQGRDMAEDYHIFKKRRYNNIFEMRYTKIKFQLEMPNKVKNHYFLRFEDLKDNYHSTIENIYDQFNLSLVNEEKTEINSYKMTGKPYAYKPPQKTFTHIDILDKIDQNIELKVGYDLMAEWEKINS